MKAVIWTKYGPPEVLVLGEIDKPVPGDNDILIKVFSVSVNAGDCEMRGLKLPFALALALRLFYGIKEPKRIKILGQDFAGEVEAVGSKVKKFKPGDRVFGSTEIGLGTYAEYVSLNQESGNFIIERMSASLDYTEASSVPVSGLEALFFLKKANLKKNERILIIGAGGSIGTHAVQLSKHYGAHVTAVDRSEKQSMLESIGADSFIDYLKDDYLNNGEKFDVIFEVAGKTKTNNAIKYLDNKGRYIVLNPTLSKLLTKIFINVAGNKKIITGVTERKESELLYLNDLIDKGILKPVIDKIYSLDEIAAAHKYAESGLKKGNVTIKIV